MIDAGADVDAFGRYDGVEGPPLWWAAVAARNGEGQSAIDLARVLIGARASVDVRGGYGPGVARTSPLVLALQGVPGNGTCAELARVLFVAGARLDAADVQGLALYRFGSAVSVVKSEIARRKVVMLFMLARHFRSTFFNSITLIVHSVGYGPWVVTATVFWLIFLTVPSV